METVRFLAGIRQRMKFHQEKKDGDAAQAVDMRIEAGPETETGAVGGGVVRLTKD